MLRTVLHTVLASALLTLVPAVPSAADTTTSAPRGAGVQAGTVPADRSGTAESAFDHVANFYGAYVDARGSASEQLGQELRRHYLTADLRRMTPRRGTSAAGPPSRADVRVMLRPVVVGLDGSPDPPVPDRLGSAPAPSHHDAFQGR